MYPARAEGGRKKSSSTQVGTNLVEVYDPRWSHALNFPDLLDVAGLLQRDVEKAAIGQTVGAEGEIELLDLSFIKGMFADENILSQLSDMWRRDNPDQHDMLMQGIRNAQHLPCSIQICFLSERLKAWGTLRSEAMSYLSSDLMIKYGLRIEGSWKIAGIKDAVPRSAPLKPASPLFGGELILSSTLFAQQYLLIAPLMRAFLGRPVGFYGITHY
jgi:hypothetical protein